MAKKRVNNQGRVNESTAQTNIAPHSINGVKTNVRVFVYPQETTNLCLPPGEGEIQLQKRAFPIGQNPREFRQAKDSFTSMNDALTEPGQNTEFGTGGKTARNIVWSQHPSRQFDSSQDDFGRPDTMLRASGLVYCPNCTSFVEPSKTAMGPGGFSICKPKCRKQNAAESPYMTRD